MRTRILGHSGRARGCTGHRPVTHQQVRGLFGAQPPCIETDYDVEAATGDLLMRQRADGCEPGVWGVGWWIADIPLDYAILVPGGSGLRLTRDTPGPTFQYDYPDHAGKSSSSSSKALAADSMCGPKIRADDSSGSWWNADPTGWRHRPDHDQRCAVRQVDRLRKRHLATQRLRRRLARSRPALSRRGSSRRCQPSPVAEQQPAWVKDIRGCVIMGLDTAHPGGPAHALRSDADAAVSLRLAGGRLRPQLSGLLRTYVRRLLPFMRRAHELGFRVMLHVNYFGVDPLHPALPAVRTLPGAQSVGQTRQGVVGLAAGRTGHSFRLHQPGVPGLARFLHRCHGATLPDNRLPMPCTWTRHSASTTTTTVGSTACRCSKGTSPCTNSCVRHCRRWRSAVKDSTK